MEKKKLSFAHFCAYLSLAISITMLVLWCCNVGGFSVVSLDSFVGIIVALLAIVVTLAIGWQIYNSIEIKEKIRKLDDLEMKYSAHDKKMNQIQYRSLHLIRANMGDFAYSNNKFLLAFLYYIQSLESSMSLDTPINIDKLLGNMDLAIDKTKNGAVCEFIDEIQKSDSKIRACKNYPVIKQRYEKIYNDFTSKIKQ